MSEMNKLINEKLKKYPADVQKLIKEAFSLADKHRDPRHVAEELKGILRSLRKS